MWTKLHRQCGTGSFVVIKIRESVPGVEMLHQVSNIPQINSCVNLDDPSEPVSFWALTKFS